MTNSSRWTTATSCPALFLLWTVAWLLATTPAMADPPTPVGAELMVNEVTVGRQLNGAFAALGNGDVIVVWEGEDADGRGIFGRRVNAAAQPVGSEFQVSLSTAGDQVSVGVEATGDGGFIAVWENDSGSETSISSRTYDAAGVAGPEVTVAPVQIDIDVGNPAISRLSDGSYIVIWYEFDSPMNDDSVRARFLDSSGNVMGASFILATGGSNESVYDPKLGKRPGGGLFVAWNYVDDPAGLWAQAFTDAASPDSSPIEITPGSYNYSRLSGFNDGSFAAVWSSNLSRAKRRQFDDMGMPGPAIDISAAEGLQRWTDVATLPDGRMAVTWITFPSSGPDHLDAQLIGIDSQVSDEWQVDTSNVSLLRSRIVYDAASAHLVLLWTRRGSPGGDQEDVILRRYSLEALLFTDSFESGDLTAWSSMSP